MGLIRRVHLRAHRSFAVHLRLAAAIIQRVISRATSLPDPVQPSDWPWVEAGRIRHLQWSAYTLPMDDLPSSLVGLRVLHLSDTHIAETWMPAWDELHDRVQRDPPDVILMTGDFVDHIHDCRPALPLLRRFADGLRARLGVWGILGNHDGEMFRLRVGEDFPVRLLHDQIVRLTDDNSDAAIEIVGVHGVSVRDPITPGLLDHLADKPPNTLRLVMAHFPSQVMTLATLKSDAIFAGHTHGGQVCLPGGHPIITHDPLPRRFARGAHRFDQTWLVVSRGLGFSGYAVRTFCPAEAIEVTLVSTASRQASSEPSNG